MAIRAKYLDMDDIPVAIHEHYMPDRDCDHATGDVRKGPIIIKFGDQEFHTWWLDNWTWKGPIVSRFYWEEHGTEATPVWYTQTEPEYPDGRYMIRQENPERFVLWGYEVNTPLFRGSLSACKHKAESIK